MLSPDSLKSSSDQMKWNIWGNLKTYFLNVYIGEYVVANEISSHIGTQLWSLLHISSHTFSLICQMSQYQHTKKSSENYQQNSGSYSSGGRPLDSRMEGSGSWLALQKSVIGVMKNLPWVQCLTRSRANYTSSCPKAKDQIYDVMCPDHPFSPRP